MRKSEASLGWKKSITVLLVVAIVFLVGMIVLQMFFGGEGILPVQILGAMVGACLTAIITLFLLIGQTESQENKDKAIKIYEQKIRVYSSFISSLWETLSDGKLEDEELRALRGKVFNELIFYLSPDSVPPFKKAVDDICAFQSKGETSKLTMAFAELTKILQDDLTNLSDKTKDSGNKKVSDNIMSLWGAFDVAPAEDERGEAPEESLDLADSQPESPNENRAALPQTWHFNILEPKAQLEAFERGVLELSLCEWGERWRTGLVEQVKPGDIVFAFIPQKNGGCGYHGVFEVEGTRVIELKDGGYYQRMIESKDGVVYEGDWQPINAEDCQKYDVYSAIGDGATDVSNIRVKPLAYSSKGVGNPGGVYRRTISRYWAGYAGKLLKLFSSLPQGPVDWAEGSSFKADPAKIADLARRFENTK